MRRDVAAILVIFLGAAPAVPGDDNTVRRGVILRAAVEVVVAHRGLTAETVWAFDLSGFEADELTQLPAAVPNTSEDVRAALRRVCGTALLRRGPLGRLENACDICFLLASPDASDWRRAFRLLRREPLGDNLDKAVLALAKDERPEVRLIAGKLATSLIAFGRTSEDLASAVLACLKDPDPNVLAACALFDAMNTGDKRVIDRMVASLSDDRALDPRARGLLRLQGWKKVSDLLSYKLSWTVFMERLARWKCMPPLDASGDLSLPGEPVYAALGPDEIRAWWKENRDAFGFGTPAPQWRCVFDDVVVVDVGRPCVVLAAGNMPLKILLKTYREAWRGDEPVTTVAGEIRSTVLGEDVHVAGVGNPDHPDGFISQERATWSDGTVFSEIDCRAAFLPTGKPGRVRMRLTVHIGHEDK